MDVYLTHILEFDHIINILQKFELFLEILSGKNNNITKIAAEWLHHYNGSFLNDYD